ncbi:MAG: 16S rRNA (cytosine(967)-C(5))-methyltransferase RsmB [Solirubrobacteraceae bacterium]
MSESARVSPARACAYAVVRRVFEHDAYADRAFHAEARELDGRERAFAMALAYGTVQRRATLDHVATQLTDRPLSRIEPAVLAALRLGLMQLLLLGGVAEHAAVHESVELAKRDSRAGAGLVNAVLRRATREGAAAIENLDDETPEHAAILRSVPVWLAELWWRELGPERARAELATINVAPESALRVNALVTSPAAVSHELGVASRPTAGLPEGLVLEQPFDVNSSELWARGAVMPQSRGSMAVGRALAPSSGERVLDLCAAPGAKTTQLAALMGDKGTLVAVERHAGRASALERTLARMHVTCATVQVADAATAELGSGYDRVLVDPPCSGLGTLQSRPDLRWRTSPERIASLSSLQARLLRAGALATRPGGSLVYSVCTISRAESDQVLDEFLAERPDFAAEPVPVEDLAANPTGGGRGDGPYVRLTPGRDGTDGFFIARLRRADR